MRRFWRAGVVLFGTLTVGVVMLMQSSQAQIPSPPTLPPFTLPSIPAPPTFPPFTTTPPPTMPPSTTTPPPTMPPSTTTPPPTMPPNTLPPRVGNDIQDAIDTLEQFGSQFQNLIQDLQELLGGG
jgi:hypothetical protein